MLFEMYSRIKNGTLRPSDPHQGWTRTFISGRAVHQKSGGTSLEGLLKSSTQRGDSQLLEAGVIRGLWGSRNRIKSSGLKTYHVPDILRES